MRSSSQRRRYRLRRPSQLIFFVDRDLGRKIVPEALRKAGVHVIAHQDMFPADTPDVDWLRVAGKQQWVVLTRNERIRHVPFERAVLLAARVRCFMVAATAATGPEAAELIVAALPQILRHCGGRSGRGFIAKITRGPRVTRFA